MISGSDSERTEVCGLDAELMGSLIAGGKPLISLAADAEHEGKVKM